ncbi:MAG: polysaccharide biosynthesis protein, partial [Deltaproteobacteria bacterium]|nr:polysaccharide biosynthesis protein [Deltaproteobacteria bacterium]
MPSPIPPIVRYRRPIVIAIHVLLTIAANYSAFFLRFDGHISNTDLDLFYCALPWLILIRFGTFGLFHLHEGLWRYTGIWDLSRIIVGAAISSGLFAVITRQGLRLYQYPISIYVLDTILVIILMGGIRLGRRIYRELRKLERGRRVLIFGAGDAGEMIVREMKHNSYCGYEPVGFIDDDPGKVGSRVHGVPVLGLREDLARIIEATVPQEVLIAIPSARAAVIRGIIAALERFRVQIRTLPNFHDLLQGKVSISQIRDLVLEDLLERRAIQLDWEPVRRQLQGKCIFVSGAAGSIGSELCRQLLALNPDMVLACDRYENGLFDLQQQVSGTFADRLLPVIADVTDAQRVHNIMMRWRPHIVFHAAAYKHVPMMQGNPCEATKNNVTGTRILAQVSCDAAVERFILISTDKAVNPTSVMGATKRVAEMLIRAMAGETPSFVTVRFGNVLGSNGSVVPQFLRQIKQGGPITVTHSGVHRFFMLIAEAVQLVLHAATTEEPGGTYVLEMGPPDRILDMARNVA